LISVERGLPVIVYPLVSISIGSEQAEDGYSFNANCVGTECIKLKVRLMCESGEHPRYMDCPTILACLEIQEQVMIKCAGGYSRTIVKT
jgi:hypothetical protein